MKTIEIAKELLLVEVPKDAKRLIIDNSLQYLIYDIPNYKNWVTDDVLGDYNKLQDFLSNHKSENDWKRGGKKLPEGKFEIIGLIETPNLDFDFDANNIQISCSISCSPIDFCKGGICDKNGCLGDNNLMIKTRIQRKIQDAGLYLVNPICINGQTFSNEHKNKWQQAEEKTIKGNLLLIKKV